MNITLRIKREFLRKIASGEKTVEYRKICDFYERLFETRPKTLTLHYQGSEKLIVSIRQIRRIKKPERFKNSPWFPGPKVFAIHLGGIISHVF